MALKKQPDSDKLAIDENADSWFRQFLSCLEAHLVETGRGLNADSNQLEYGIAAMRAVAMTLHESGLGDEHVRLVVENVLSLTLQKPGSTEWTETLNQ
ncbi:hypothetical protein [Rhodopirellula sp. MGV]|uniref:hypothetical protein n=1 Tax=Rhodopirellula sp. MGV TaxID=2023130 RepID=UPI000B9736DC|nr:hypothetical protein [Rhodopirellula sp. MGV]OYP29971.1 hypothetical protein CGZ80_23420 [Rhodopirellula sp. MGV]PNY33427.1 hypothetical protein C2E31_28430 [Rhodopirellula baltica]